MECTVLGETDSELLGRVVHKIFFENRDLHLLLVLLAAGSGIEKAFLTMMLFDEKFRFAIKYKHFQFADISYTVQSSKP